MTHALLSASSSSRWLACTPSARLEEKFPETISVYAEEGSLAHELAEVIGSYNLGLINKTTKNKKIKSLRENQLYQPEMLNYVDEFTQFVWEERNAIPASEVHLEEKVDYSAWAPEGFGTADVLIMGDGFLEVIDFKYGKGVKVQAEENTQMMLYALGALEKYDLYFGFKYIKMVIYQPRIENISIWEIPVEKLMSWANTNLKEKAHLAWDGAGEYRVGNHCRFCRAKPVCRKFAIEQLKLTLFEEQQPETLTRDEISHILKIADQTKNWVESVKAYAINRALQGEEYPGWKVVEGRSDRVIPKQEEDAFICSLREDLTDEQIFNVKLKGITELEKLLGKERFSLLAEPYITRQQGKPTLVPETDKRQEWNGAAIDFANINM